MLALFGIGDGNGLGQGRDHIAVQRQGIGSVVQQLVPARLRLEHHGEGRIAHGIDRGDMVHLDGDFEAHGITQTAGKALMRWRGQRACARKITSKRISLPLSAGWRVSQYCAARVMRDRFTAPRAMAVSALRPRVLTSTKMIVPDFSTTRSISPTGVLNRLSRSR